MISNSFWKHRSSRLARGRCASPISGSATLLLDLSVYRRSIGANVGLPPIANWPSHIGAPEVGSLLVRFDGLKVGIDWTIGLTSDITGVSTGYRIFLSCSSTIPLDVQTCTEIACCCSHATVHGAQPRGKLDLRKSSSAKPKANSHFILHVSWLLV